MEKEKSLHTQIYVVCGKTDMRKGIDGLAAVIAQYKEDKLFENEAIFLFCDGKKTDTKCCTGKKMDSRRLFGTSSEKSSKIGLGQLTIFDEN